MEHFLQDPRMTTPNGLRSLGEASAIDYWHRRLTENVLVERRGATTYLVFRVPEISFEVEEVPAVARPRRRKATSIERAETPHQAAIRCFDRQHPADLKVDVTLARGAIDLIELGDQPLVTLMKQFGILADPASEPPDRTKLHRHWGQFDIAIVGRRAVEWTGTDRIDVLCTCSRFGYRGSCQHTIFARSLDLPGVRASSGPLSMFTAPNVATC